MNPEMSTIVDSGGGGDAEFTPGAAPRAPRQVRRNHKGAGGKGNKGGKGGKGKVEREIVGQEYDYHVPLIVDEQLSQAVRWIVIRSPDGSQQFTVPLKGLSQSDGSISLVSQMATNNEMGKKERVMAFACASLFEGSMCPLGMGCQSIHLPPAMWAQRRDWVCCAF